MKIEDIRFKTVLESFIFGTSLIVVTMMIYESESIWSCLVQLMDEEQEAAHHLNFKWLTILLALQWYGILAKPSLVVSRILTFCSTLIVVSILISIITIIVIYGALYLSFATHNCIQIHQEIVAVLNFKWLMIFLVFTWYGILAKPLAVELNCWLEINAKIRKPIKSIFFDREIKNLMLWAFQNSMIYFGQAELLMNGQDKLHHGSHYSKSQIFVQK